MNISRLILVFIFFSGLFVGPTQAAVESPSTEAIGKTGLVIGRVFTKDDKKQIRIIKRDEQIFNHQIIFTDRTGFAQLRFIDGTLVNLRASTEFRVADYIYNKNLATDKSDFELLKGGLRVVTGQIAKKNNETFKLKNPVGTIGVRGTDFSSVMCSNNCGEDNVTQGLYVGVNSGRILLSHNGATISLKKGEYAHLPHESAAPKQIDEPPKSLDFPDPTSSDNTAKSDQQLSPDEDLVRHALKTAPAMTNEIIKQSLDAGITPNRIIVLSSGLGIDPANVAGPLMANAKDESLFNTLLKLAPDRADDILIAAFAHPDADIAKITNTAKKSGVSPKVISDSKAVGNLLRPRNKTSVDAKASDPLATSTQSLSSPTSTLQSQIATPILLPQSGTGNGEPLSGS